MSAEEHAAFAAVYERHHRALFRYCRSIVGHEQDAQDALQSTMANALSALRDKPLDFDPQPWLFRIAHNEAVSILRRRRPTAELDVDIVQSDEVHARVERHETLRLLRQDLADLPERQRAALLLRELHGLGSAQIAELLGTTPGAVNQAVLEARRALSRCEDGRATPCYDVQRAFSDGDRRVIRARNLRAHLRSCPSCRRFRADLERRPTSLAALAPTLPGAVASLPSSAGAGAAGSLGAGLVAKVAVGVLVTATAATGVSELRHPGHAAAPVRPAAVLAAPAPLAASQQRVTVAGGRERPRTVVRGAGASPTPPAARRQANAPVPAPAGTGAAPKPAKPHARGGGARYIDKPDGAAPGTLNRPARQDPAPPGQAKKATPPGQDTVTGQAKKTTPPGPPKKAAGAARPGTPPGQAKKAAGAAVRTPPGQAKKAAGAAVRTPPGQAKKAAGAVVRTPPGQAKKAAGPAVRATPPSQANKAAGAAGRATPPGQAKKAAGAVAAAPAG